MRFCWTHLKRPSCHERIFFRQSPFKFIFWNFIVCSHMSWVSNVHPLFSKDWGGGKVQSVSTLGPFIHTVSSYSCCKWIKSVKICVSSFCTKIAKGRSSMDWKILHLIVPIAVTQNHLFSLVFYSLIQGELIRVLKKFWRTYFFEGKTLIRLNFNMLTLLFSFSLQTEKLFLSYKIIF